MKIPLQTYLGSESIRKLKAIQNKHNIASETATMEYILTGHELVTLCYPLKHTHKTKKTFYILPHIYKSLPTTNRTEYIERVIDTNYTIEFPIEL